MRLPVSGAGLGRFLCGKAVPDVLGGSVDAHLLSQLILLFHGSFYRLKPVGAGLNLCKGGGD